MAHCLLLMAEQQTFTPRMEAAVLSETLETVYTRHIRRLNLHTEHCEIINSLLLLLFLWYNSPTLVQTASLRFLDRTHTQPVGHLCTSDQPLPTQHAANARDDLPCSQRDPSNQAAADPALDHVATAVTFTDLLHVQKA
jgi:hypothetical protein